MLQPLLRTKTSIPPQHLRQLWEMKQESGKPMMILVAKALDWYFQEAMS